MTDEAVSSWRFDIHKCILRNCERLVELCVVKLHDDWFPLLDLFAMVLNPANKFHLYNGSRPSEFNLKQYILQQQAEQKASADNENRDCGDGPATESLGIPKSFVKYHLDKLCKDWLEACRLNQVTCLCMICDLPRSPP